MPRVKVTKRSEMESSWRAHLDGRRRSDLNQREYCKAHGLPLKRFSNGHGCNRTICRVLSEESGRARKSEPPVVSSGNLTPLGKSGRLRTFCANRNAVDIF